VTARVVGHELGDKVRIGKYRRRTGYRRHNGFRASLTQIEIESIGGGAKKAAAKPKAEAAPAPKPEAEPAQTGAQPPEGYGDMTIAQITEGAATWSTADVDAALEYERANANRKGAITALERARAQKEAD
jgi:hypothetical protein